MEWLTLIIGLIGGSTAALLIDKLLLVPELRISFRASERYGTIIQPCVVTRAVTTGRGERAYRAEQQTRNWIRVSVENVRVGVAAKCRAYLTDVQYATESGELIRLFWDCIPLKWSCMADDRFDIPKGIHALVDVLYAYGGNRTRLCACIDHAGQPRYDEMFSRFGDYILTLVVGGANAAPQTFRLRVEWRGNWERIEANEVS
jgi:hypothetical protein